LSGLDDVLVVTVRKSFWASTEAERWPRRVYAHVLRGHSTSLLNSVPVFARALGAIWLRKPRLVLLGSTERTVPWFIGARRVGLLRGAKLAVTNQLNLSPGQLEQVDRVIVYASAQAAALGEKGVFFPLPADGDLEAARRAAEPGEYVFSGGGAGRDYETLIEAVRGTGVPVELVVFRPDSLGETPANVRVIGPLPVKAFLTRMAGAVAVAVPLESFESPHGQTTLVQALALGKPVVATRSVGVVDYVTDGENGLLVEAGDTAGLRAALERLLADDDLRARLSAGARARSHALSYAHHGALLAELAAQQRAE
jgi:UDP:flavonoid glycosyltransferase YjiC (YdhE family)